MHIQSDDALVDRNQFQFASLSKYNWVWEASGAEPKLPEGDRSPAALLTCALDGGNPGYESIQRVTLRIGVIKPPKYCSTFFRSPPAPILSSSGVAANAMTVEDEGGLPFLGLEQQSGIEVRAGSA
jgi:hypothetical protein